MFVCLFFLFGIFFLALIFNQGMRWSRQLAVRSQHELCDIFYLFIFCLICTILTWAGGRVHAGKAEKVKGDATLPGFCNSPLKSWYQTITSFPHTDSGLNTDGHSGTHTAASVSQDVV